MSGNHIFYSQIIRPAVEYNHRALRTLFSFNFGLKGTKKFEYLEGCVSYNITYD